MKHLLKITPDRVSHKIGMDEVEGLKAAMTEALKPVQEFLKDRIYWSDVDLEEAEYKSRSGFIPHSHNCGGLMISQVVPKCEEYNFGFIEFGECDVCGTAECVNDKGEFIQCGYEGQECSSESDGHLDSYFRVWFKFEGIDEVTGALQFYLVLSGGNEDAPYFREKYQGTLFEASFECKSIAGLKRSSAKHIKLLLKTLGAK